MQISLILEWKHAILRELNTHKGKVLIGYGAVLIVLVITAFLWPKQYESGAVLYVDYKKIMEPLLKGNAAVSGLGTNPMDLVTERVTSAEFLEEVVLEAKLVPNADDRKLIAGLVGEIGSMIEILDMGKSYIKVAYYDADPNRAHLIAGAVARTILSNSSQSKRTESKQAYAFIESQVETYREKLQAAEEKLKNFRSEHTDGSEGTAGQRITQLRKDIEMHTLDLQVARAQRDELRDQISRESRVINQNFRANVYRERLNESQSRLDTLRLSYQETYPDIVSLKLQIEDLKRAISDAESGRGGQDGSEASVNPLYQQMRGALTDAEVKMRTTEMRLASARNSLTSEESRSRFSAELQAQLAELTRDYDVTRGLYEDMLQSREKARLSMALDEAGQGAAFKIAQPARKPTQPTGLTFIHIFSAAPFIAILAPLGLIIAYIVLDPRVRFAAKVDEALPEGLPLLAVLPHTISSYERRNRRGEWMQYAMIAGAGLLIYGGIGFVKIMGAQ